MIDCHVMAPAAIANGEVVQWALTGHYLATRKEDLRYEDVDSRFKTIYYHQGVQIGFEEACSLLENEDD